MQQDSKTLILVDGHALAFRSFFALERTNMQTTDNQPTWAVYGFFKALFDLLKNKDIKPNCIAVAFDVGRKTFRVEKYPEYKANRQSMPDSLHSQIGLICEGLKAFNIPIFTKEGFEADDVIGTIANKAAALNNKTFILTGDQDSFQLVRRDNLIEVLVPSSGELRLYNWDNVYEKLSIYPNQVVDYKALRGDTSDNIPGIKGVGEKTAVKLLAEYKTLDEIYRNIDSMPQNAMTKKLREGKEIAYLSQFLATIDCDVDIDFDFECTHLELPNLQDVKAFLTKNQFYSFLKNLPEILTPFGVETVEQNSSTEDVSSSNASIQMSLFSSLDNLNVGKTDENIDINFSTQVIDTTEKLEDLVQGLKNSSIFGFDTETTSLDVMEAELVGMSFAYDDKSFYIPVQHQVGEQLELEYVLSVLKPLLEDDNVKKTLQNAKYEINVLKNYSINLAGIAFDTMLASYIFDSRRKHGLKIQALEHLNYVMRDYDDLTSKNAIPMNCVPIEEACDYACADAFFTLKLTEFYKKKLSEKELKLLYEIELPLVDVLAEMERTGVSIDLEYFQSLAKDINEKLETIEKSIYEEAGEVFNISSPKQLADVLFNKLKLPTKQKKKISTNAKVLEELAQEHDIAKKIIEQRHLAKLKSTYVDNLPKLLSKTDNRIHTNYNQTVTTTGRLSSSNPNLQNIPIRTKLGNKIRGGFTPANKEDSLILSADYSQIELRLLAHYSKDETLINAFKNDEDIHTITASKIFEVPISDVTKEMRSKAKTVNFGIIYGQTRFGLASTLKIPPAQAQIFIDKYFEQYLAIKNYITETLEFAHKNGYVETMFGRRRYFNEELNSRNAMIREFVQRAAINSPLQGSAADLIKLAMIELYKKLIDKKFESKLILQVHDELVLEVKKDELDELKKVVQESMELNQPLLVPLKIDVAIGESWMEL